MKDGQRGEKSVWLDVEEYDYVDGLKMGKSVPLNTYGIWLATLLSEYVEQER